MTKVDALLESIQTALKGAIGARKLQTARDAQNAARDAAAAVNMILIDALPALSSAERQSLIFQAVTGMDRTVIEAAYRMQVSRAARQGDRLGIVRGSVKTDRAKNLATLADRLIDEEGDPGELSQSQHQQLADTIENNARLAVDDQEHDLAESRYNMGRRPTITRTTAGAHPCEWCQSYAGVYAYGPDMDKAHAFGRHNNCACIIEYDPGTGKTETVRNYSLKSRNREQLMRRDADFYVGANGKALLAKYKDWIGENQMRRLLGVAEHPETKKVIRADFRPTSFIGDGNTASIRRFEKATGLNCGRDGRTHEQKARDLSRYIEKTLLQDIPEDDKILLNEMLSELREVQD